MKNLPADVNYFSKPTALGMSPLARSKLEGGNSGFPENQMSGYDLADDPKWTAQENLCNITIISLFINGDLCA